jgi:hypothetical protein
VVNLNPTTGCLPPLVPFAIPENSPLVCPALSTPHLPVMHCGSRPVLPTRSNCRPVTRNCQSPQVQTHATAQSLVGTQAQAPARCPPRRETVVQELALTMSASRRNPSSFVVGNHGCGLENIDTIIQMVFIIESVLDQYSAGSTMNYGWPICNLVLSQQPAADYVSSCAAHMHLYSDPQHYLSGPYKVKKKEWFQSRRVANV